MKRVSTIPIRKKSPVIKVVVDTNIIFSGLLNSNSKIGDLLFNSEKHFKFYSCDYMRFEIDKHWKKLKKISKLTEQELETANYQILNKINFINEALIPEKIWLKSENLVRDFDIDDLDFVALSKYIKGSLWTGDKVLYNGLKKNGFEKVLSTNELFALRENKI